MIKTANPTMITLARELRGVRQKDLAKKLKITQAAISKIEAAQLVPENNLVSKIASSLEYPDSFFYEPFEIYPTGMQFYRKHKTLPAGFSKKIEAAINVYRLHITKLLNAAEIDFVEIPESNVEEYDSASQIARAVRQYLRLPRGTIKNLTELLESLGIIIIPFDAGTRLFSGVVSLVVNTENYVIMVNSQMPPDRLRWTLAHEFGHILMHRYPSKTMEEEADEFAGEFLMPYEELKPQLKDMSIKNLAALKRYYRVSISGILTYAHKRGIISEWHHRQLRIELAKEGITRTKEPNLNLIKEEPTLLKELIDFHLNELNYSVDQLSNLLGLLPLEFLRLYKPELSNMTAVNRNGLRLVS